MTRRATPLKALAGAATCAVLAAGSLTACAGGQSSTSGPGGSDSRFVSGTGAAQVVAAGARKPAPDVEGTTLDGARLKPADFKGKVVVLNFWASWCAPCRGEAPALEKVYAEHKAEGVEFVGIDMREASEDSGKAFVRTYKISYPNIYDKDGRVTLAFRDIPPSAVPSTLILDRQGRVAVRIIGSTTYSKLNPLVTQVAAEK